MVEIITLNWDANDGDGAVPPSKLLSAAGSGLVPEVAFVFVLFFTNAPCFLIWDAKDEEEGVATLYRLGTGIFQALCVLLGLVSFCFFLLFAMYFLGSEDTDRVIGWSSEAGESLQRLAGIVNAGCCSNKNEVVGFFMSLLL